MPPLVVAIEMGYGHLRAATPLAERLATEVLLADRPPIAGPDEERLWRRARRWYERTTRLSQLARVGAAFRPVVERMTEIAPLHPRRDQSAPHPANRLLERWIDAGLGKELATTLTTRGEALLTTFYAPAIAVDRLAEVPVYCVVTDVDVHRIWVPSEPHKSRIHYLVPAERTRRRLRAYGVDDGRISVTGFPLPHALLGGPSLEAAKANLRRRLVRLDPRGRFRRRWGQATDAVLGTLESEGRQEPVHLVYAVGGAGAQATLPRTFLPSLAPLLQAGALKLTLVAGIRADVRVALEAALEEAGLRESLGEAIDILAAPDMASYLAAFEVLLADADILWTKPSELTFYGALGLPLVLAWPVGVHERYNRRWAIEAGAGIKQHDPRQAGAWLAELLEDGTLAHAAWQGFMQLPKRGLYDITARVRGELAAGLDEVVAGAPTP